MTFVKIKIVCVGKLKDAFFRDAVAEYAKRLSRFCTLEVCEVADEKAPESLSPAEEEQVKEREGERLLAKLLSGEFVVCLAIDGKRYSSEQFAAFLQSTFDRSASTISRRSPRSTARSSCSAPAASCVFRAPNCCNR